MIRGPFMLGVRHRRRGYFINLYRHERRYGGPEEGGWWYSVYTPARSIYCRRYPQARRTYNRLESHFRDAWGEYGGIAVRLERQPGRHQSETPWYE